VSTRIPLHPLPGAFLALTLATACSSPSPAPERSGKVALAITCDPAVADDFQGALALLHSFFYEEARRRFLAITERDPHCAMAWWGVAMTYYHPLWSPPTAEELARGADAARKAKAITNVNDLERGLIAAVDAFYRTADAPADASAPMEMSCHGPRAHGARAAAFRDSLADLAKKHPDNIEAAAFHSLALLGTAPPGDASYANQLRATAILEPLFEHNPEHPGLAHYIIHAYDYPSLATRGLLAARKYGDIAPWVPHALHMPSHIYTRLGMWRESIASNEASVRAARDYMAKHYGGAVWYDELHALDYLVYAHMQLAEDGKARAIVAYLQDIEKFQEPNFAAAYAIGAIPARYALERRAWAEAAALPILHPSVVTPFPFAVAHTAFARGIGAARKGDVDGARAAIGELAKLRDALTEPKLAWWSSQVEIQRLSVAGWAARAAGDDAEGQRMLREAAALEDKVGIHPVTPGQVLPAHEQLGDLLRELGRHEEALAEYRATLAAFPRRFHALHGAAQAAEAAGRREEARRHYADLVELAGDGDGKQTEIAHARAFLRQR
jgi:tetratricopeptide (TPR) repeat protein